MSFVRHSFRKPSVLTGAFLFTSFAALSLSFAGCQQAGSGVPSALATPKGLLAESFLPQDSFVVLEFGASNQQQQDAFTKLLQHFPADDQQTFQQSLVQGFDKDLTTVGLDYEKDLVPALGTNVHVLVAFKGQPTKQDQPDVYAFVPLADTTKMDAVFDKLVQGGSFTKETYNSKNIFTTTTGNKSEFMSRVDDLLVVANSDDVLKQALDRQQTGQPSLLKDSSYQKALGELKPSLAFGYINVQGIFNVLKQDPTSRTQFEKAFGQLPGGSFVEALQGEMFSVQAEDKGLRLYGTAYGDEEKMKASAQNFMTLPNHEPYLYKRVPGDSIIAYLEGYNLHQILDTNFAQMQGIDGFPAALEQLKSGFSYIGVDFDKEFLALFDEGVAFDFRNNGSLIPSVALYTDVANHVEEANKIIGKLKLIVDGALKNASTTSLKDTPGLLTNDEAVINGTPVYVLRLHLDKVGSDNKNLAALQLFLTKPVEVWYGITDDKLAFIALEPNFDQSYKGSSKVKDDQSFQDATAQLPGLNSSIFYMSPGTFASYLDKIYGLAQMSGGASTDQNQKDYQKVKSYLNAFKGFAFTAQAVSAGEAHLNGFVVIQ